MSERHGPSTNAVSALCPRSRDPCTHFISNFGSFLKQCLLNLIAMDSQTEVMGRKITFN